MTKPWPKRRDGKTRQLYTYYSTLFWVTYWYIHVYVELPGLGIYIVTICDIHMITILLHILFWVRVFVFFLQYVMISMSVAEWTSPITRQPFFRYLKHVGDWMGDMVTC